jgi:hypothetical protein
MRRVVRQTVRFLIVLVFVGVASTARGDHPPIGELSGFDIYVTEEIFVAICEQLDFDDEQRQAASALYDQYVADLLALHEETQRRVDEAGYAEYRRIAPSPLLPDSDPPWDEMTRLWHQYHPEFIRGHRECDQLLLRFYGELESLLDEDDLILFERVPRLVRRLCFLRKVSRPRVARGDLQGNVDLLDLVQQASGEDGELHILAGPADEPHTAREILEARLASRQLLLAYEIQRDQILLDSIAWRRRPLESDAQARSTVGATARSRALIQRMVREFDLNDRTAMQIADLLRSIGEPERAEAWRTRFYTRFCPDLYADRWPDGMVEWLSDRDDADEEQIAAARELLERYRSVRARLREQAVKAGVNAIRKHFTRAGTEPEHLRYGRCKLKLRELGHQTVNEFASLLTVEQREDFEAATSRLFAIFQSWAIGPRLETQLIRALTDEELPPGGSLPQIDVNAEKPDSVKNREGDNQ